MPKMDVYVFTFILCGRVPQHLPFSAATLGVLLSHCDGRPLGQGTQDAIHSCVCPRWVDLCLYPFIVGGQVHGFIPVYTREGRYTILELYHFSFFFGFRAIEFL
jgi:hypothetical protein